MLVLVFVFSWHRLGTRTHEGARARAHARLHAPTLAPMGGMGEAGQGAQRKQWMTRRSMCLAADRAPSSRARKRVRACVRARASVRVRARACVRVRALVPGCVLAC